MLDYFLFSYHKSDSIDKQLAVRLYKIEIYRKQFMKKLT